MRAAALTGREAPEGLRQRQGRWASGAGPGTRRRRERGCVARPRKFVSPWSKPPAILGRFARRVARTCSRRAGPSRARTSSSRRQPGRAGLRGCRAKARPGARVRVRPADRQRASGVVAAPRRVERVLGGGRHIPLGSFHGSGIGQPSKVTARRVGCGQGDRITVGRLPPAHDSAPSARPALR